MPQVQPKGFPLTRVDFVSCSVSGCSVRSARDGKCQTQKHDDRKCQRNYFLVSPFFLFSFFYFFSFFVSLFLPIATCRVAQPQGCGQSQPRVVVHRNLVVVDRKLPLAHIYIYTLIL